MGDADPLDRTVDGRDVGRAKPGDRRFVGQTTQRDDLRDRHRERQVGDFRHDGDRARQLLARHVLDRLAEKLDGPGAWREDAGHGPEQRGLAGTVRSDEGEPLARRDRQLGTIDHRPSGIADGQRLGRDRGDRGGDRGHSS